MFKNIVYCMLLVFVIGCGNKEHGTANSRSFEFEYSVELLPAPNKKLELWIPIPQSNEVQSISDLTVDSQGIDYEIKDEDDHGNKYLYIYSDGGIKDSKLITLTFNVLREEHKNVEYENIVNDRYL